MVTIENDREKKQFNQDSKVFFVRRLAGNDLVKEAVFYPEGRFLALPSDDLLVYLSDAERDDLLTISRQALEADAAENVKGLGRNLGIIYPGNIFHGSDTVLAPVSPEATAQVIGSIRRGPYEVPYPFGDIPETDIEAIEEVDPWKTIYWGRILTHTEEILLTRAARYGPPDVQKLAENTLMFHNLRLIRSIAFRRSDRRIPREDLVQEGAIGFLIAERRFEPQRNLRLGTYATWWIVQKIRRYIHERANAIRIPVPRGERMDAAMSAIGGFIQEFGRNPTEDEVRDILGLSGLQVRNLQSAFSITDILDLDSPVYDDPDFVHLNTIPLFYQQPDLTRHEFEKYADSMLTAKQERVIRMYMGWQHGAEERPGMATREIAKRMGVTSSMVRSIVREAGPKILEMLGLRDEIHPVKKTERIAETDKVILETAEKFFQSLGGYQPAGNGRRIGVAPS